MATLICTKLSEPPVRNFTCGNRSIDTSIKDSYELTLIRRCYAYSIKSENTILGYYMIALKCFSLSEINEPFDEYSFGRFEDLYTMHIEYVAIDERYQQRGIGTAVLKKIIYDAQTIAEKCPLRMLTMDALSSKVQWYKELGFQNVLHYSSGTNPETKLMYMDFSTRADFQKLEEIAANNM